MPHDLLLKTVNTIHRTLLTISGGKIGWSASDMPVIELITTGRKSGQPRAVMLTSPYVEGNNMAIVASRGGDDRHPAWFLNLSDNPSVTVKTAEGTQAMTARIVDADERAELWPKITEKAKNYAGYQSKTDREIPVVMLEPAE